MATRWRRSSTARSRRSVPSACCSARTPGPPGRTGSGIACPQRRPRGALGLSDPACRPFFEKAAALGAAITVHYGVTVDPSGDLRYGDPTDLSPVARDYPDMPFVIAHFGAGYLHEALRLGYQCKNVCLDSSGTNNWMDYDPHGYTLAQVFDRALTALGPERVLFGTDSGTTGPYRKWIAFQQRRTLEELGLSQRERDLVLRANAVRIFRLEE
jgi:predicted TIM-barrel fold metal-dependent hydrolase